MTSWVIFECKGPKYNIHHALLLMVFEFHEIWIDPQLLTGNASSSRPSFKTLQELSHFRANKVDWLQDKTEYDE